MDAIGADIGGAVMTLKIESPCGKDIPAWPQVMRVPCASAYTGTTVGFIEARLRDGSIPFIDGAQERLIEKSDLDKWIAEQPRRTGKLREPKAATAARVGAA